MNQTTFFNILRINVFKNIYLALIAVENKYGILVGKIYNPRIDIHEDWLNGYCYYSAESVAPFCSNKNNKLYAICPLKNKQEYQDILTTLEVLYDID